MKKLFTLLALVIGLSASAQVPKKIIVEHFTNTYCSVCASRNPGLFNNLKNFPNVTLLSYHPSSPYPQCPLNQYNKTANDGRTNFYGVYGSTPRIVVNGKVISAQTNYASSQFIDEETNKMSDFLIHVSIDPSSLFSDSIRIEVRIKKEGNGNLTSGKLFIGLFEDTVFRTNSNGEVNPRHVYRGGPIGLSTIQLPNNQGDSMTYVFKTASLSGIAGDLFASAILYNETNVYEQAGISDYVSASPNGIKYQQQLAIEIYPNPAQNMLHTNATETLNYSLLDFTGKVIETGVWEAGAELQLNAKPGMYFLHLNSNQAETTKRLLIQP